MNVKIVRHMNVTKMGYMQNALRQVSLMIALEQRESTTKRVDGNE